MPHHSITARKLRKLLSWKAVRRRYEKKHNRDFLFDMVPESSVCAEIGVYKGDFSQQILDCVKPNKLHLVDPWQYQSSEAYSRALYGGLSGGQQKMDDIHASVLQRFRSEIRHGIVEVHRSFSEAAATRFPDTHFDWIYIDGNHLYEFMISDLKLYCPKVKGGGIIAGDDYREGGWWKGGVKRAVDEFLQTGLVDLIGITNNQFVLRRRA